MDGLGLWHISSTKSEIREVSVEKHGNASLLVKSLHSLISMGTERIISKGLVPPDLSEDMRVPYMQGNFSFPCTYGYSLVGEILEGPDRFVGRNVHIMHPHQDYAVVRIEDIYLIPDEILPKTATLASNMETALTGIWDSRVSIGDEVLLVGFGIIGALLARLLFRYPNVDLTIVEKDDYRLSRAKELGFKAVKASTELEGSYDLAFNCSGSQRGLQVCIDRLAHEGKVVEMSWYGDQPVSLRLGQEFHIKRNQIISSQVSKIPASKMHRWDRTRRKELVFEILKDPYYNQVICEEISFNDSPSAFERIRNDEVEGLGVLINY